MRSSVIEFSKEYSLVRELHMKLEEIEKADSFFFNEWIEVVSGLHPLLHTSYFPTAVNTVSNGDDDIGEAHST